MPNSSRTGGSRIWMKINIVKRKIRPGIIRTNFFKNNKAGNLGGNYEI